MTRCHYYDIKEIKWWHFLIPPVNQIYKLCESHDKTYMFLVAFCRLLIYILLFNFLIENDIIKFYTDDSIKYFLFIIMVLALIISTGFMIGSIFKEQLYEKEEKRELAIVENPPRLTDSTEIDDPNFYKTISPRELRNAWFL